MPYTRTSLPGVGAARRGRRRRRRPHAPTGTDRPEPARKEGGVRMRILAWHVHGSWMTAFVNSRHDVVVPVVPGRGPDGLGRATTYPWPARVREVTPEEVGDTSVDVVVLQRARDL